MSAGGVFRILLAVVVALAAGWWLLADTVRYYSPTAESTPLRVGFWGDFQEYKMWQECRDAWERKHPDIPVNLEYIALRYGQKIHQLLVADAAPDVILYQDEPMPGRVAAGNFQDLTEFLATPGYEIDLKRYWKTSVDSFGRWEGEGDDKRWHQYGVPVWGGCNLMLYNRSVFAKEGIRVETRSVPVDADTGDLRRPLPPGLRREAGGWVLNDQAWTVDDFVTLCEVLTKDEDGDKRIDQFGIWIPGTIYWLPWHWVLGASMLDRTCRYITWYGPECEMSLQLWQDLLFKYHVAPRPAELGVMGANVGLMTGRVAMQSTGPWLMPFLNATDTPYDILHMPRGPDGYRATRITWDSVAMFSGSKKKKEAWMLMHHLSGAECQAIVAKYQRSIPALKSAQDAFVSHNPKVSVRKFVETIGEYGRMQPISEHWDLMARRWAQARSRLHSSSDENRLTPAETIGLFLSQEDLRKKLPPLDESEAERYRAIYRQRQKEGAK